MATKIPLLIFLIVSVFFIVPFFFMVYGAIVPSYTSHNITLDFIIQAFTSPTLLPVLLNTVEFGLGGAALEVVLSTIYAWLIVRTDVPFKGVFKLLPILPLTIPFVVKGFAWIFLFAPNIGAVNLFLEQVFGLPNPPFNIFSMAGMMFAWGVGGLPFGYLIMESAFSSLDPSHEESSRTSGAGTLRTLFRVTLPLVRPAIFATFLLGFIGGVENFDYPFILGSRARITTLATKVYNEVYLGQTSLAAAYGIVYLIITLALISVYLWSIRGSYRFVVVGGKASQATLFRLGRWKWVGLLICAVILLLAFGLPMFMLVMVSLVKYYTVAPGVNPFTSLTLQNYVDALKVPQLWQSAVNSFEVSIAAGLLSTVLATIIAYAVLKMNFKGRQVLDYVSNLPLAFPGVVYSIALIWTFLTIPLFNTYLYGSLAVMVIALTTTFMPYSLRIMSSQMIQLSNELEEAATVAGSTFLHRLPRVLMPLLRRGLVNSFLYVMLDSFRELGSVILLYNASSILMIILITNLFEQSASSLPQVAALSVIMVLILGATLVLVRILTRTKLQS